MPLNKPLKTVIVNKKSTSGSMAIIKIEQGTNNISLLPGQATKLIDSLQEYLITLFPEQNTGSIIKTHYS